MGFLTPSVIQLQSKHSEVLIAISKSIKIRYTQILIIRGLPTNYILCALLSVGFVDKKLIRDLLKECARMYKFDHPNVLKLSGVCLDGGPAPYIIMPFMANGSLLSHLRNERENLVLEPNFKRQSDDAVRCLQFSYHAVTVLPVHVKKRGVIIMIAYFLAPRDVFYLHLP